MRRRRRRVWPWLLIAAVIAAAGWVVLARRSGSSIPLPGRAISTPLPKERITDAERRRLERILDERGARD